MQQEANLHSDVPRAHRQNEGLIIIFILSNQLTQQRLKYRHERNTTAASAPEVTLKTLSTNMTDAFENHLHFVSLLQG